MPKNHLASSIRIAEDARNILPYAIEDEQFFFKFIVLRQKEKS
jgi:hypothetical protein